MQMRHKQSDGGEKVIGNWGDGSARKL